MEEKYSSNVLSGGQLGMVEVPDSRYVLLPSSKTLSLNWCNCFHVKNHSSLIHASVVHTLAFVKNWLLCKLSTAVEKPPLLFPIVCCVRYLQPDTICKNTITKSRRFAYKLIVITLLSIIPLYFTLFYIYIYIFMHTHKYIGIWYTYSVIDTVLYLYIYLFL